MDCSERHVRLQFESRVLTLAKDADYPEENQDCCQIDEARGVAVVADGVSSAIFSRLWARILVEAAAAEFPDPHDRAAFAAWLAERREAWSRQIDVSRLAWFQKPKFREGAFSTLLRVELRRCEDDLSEGSAPWRLGAVALGDTCLFHVREGKLVRKFPIQTAAELESDPVVLGSVDLNRDDLLEFRRMEESCRPGDLVVLCTDAMADWALRLEESGSPPSWPAYWDMPQGVWEEEIKTLRSDRKIRCDDTTLVLLRVAEEASLASPTAARSGAELPAPQDQPAQIAEGSSGEPPPVPPPVDDAPAAVPSPVDQWLRTMEKVSEQVARQVADGTVWAAKRLKHAGQTARSALSEYLRKLRSGDRE